MTKTWSSDEIEFLKVNYKKIEISQLAEIMQRTPRSIEQKASRLCLRKTRKWTQKDYQFLIQNYDSLSNKEISKYLSTTVHMVESKAGKLGLRKSEETKNKLRNKWPIEDIQYLKDNYKQIPPKQICNNLGITLGTLYRMAQYYGLHEKTYSNKYHTKTNKKWSMNEVDFLIEHYMNMSHQEIADYLNRTKQSVIKKLSDLDKRKYERNLNWSNKEIEFLKDNYENGLMIKMQEHLKRSFKAIHTKANELGLKRDVSTYIEREVEEILKKLSIHYETQIKIRGFIVDFLLPHHKVIEVQGDYWHCNPRIYDKPKDEIQKKENCSR